MEASAVYRKTPKGDEEIKTRRAKLAPKVRTMLILVDGKKTKGELDAVAKQLAIAEDYLAMLEGAGLIARAGNSQEGGANRSAAAAVTPEGELQRFMLAQRFMNETVVDALGMRSFFFTLKLEKCSTRTELAELLDGYREALAKKVSAEEADVLTARARELLA